MSESDSEKLSETVPEPRQDISTAMDQLASHVAALQVQVNAIAKKQKPLPPRYKRRITWPEAYLLSIWILGVVALLVGLSFAYVV